MTYVCPVCGFDELPAPPTDFEICSSCGTEFGLDDYERTHEQLRLEWIVRGAKWWSRSVPPPPNWDAARQLVTAGLLDPQMVASSSTAAQIWGVETQGQVLEGLEVSLEAEVA